MSYALGQFGTLTGGVKAVAAITSDPYLPEVVCNVLRLERVQSGKPAGQCAKTPVGLQGGIGLSSAVGPLRAFVFHRQHPWIVPFSIAAIVGASFLAGYYTRSA